MARAARIGSGYAPGQPRKGDALRRPTDTTMPSHPSAAPPSANQPHLLVVDDDADMLRLLTIRLTAAGYRVTARSLRPRQH